jgi:hypothetical protein
MVVVAIQDYFVMETLSYHDLSLIKFGVQFGLWE